MLGLEMTSTTIMWGKIVVGLFYLFIYHFYTPPNLFKNKLEAGTPCQYIPSLEKHWDSNMGVGLFVKLIGSLWHQEGKWFPHIAEFGGHRQQQAQRSCKADFSLSLSLIDWKHLVSELAVRLSIHPSKIFGTIVHPPRWLTIRKVSKHSFKRYILITLKIPRQQI